MRTIQAARKSAVRHRVQGKERSSAKKYLKVVARKKRSHLISLPDIPFSIFLITVSLLTAGIMVNVAQKAIVSQISYDMESVKKDIVQAKQVQDRLLAQKARLKSPQRIEAIATKKLLMVKTPKISYLRMDNNDLGESNSAYADPSVAMSDKHVASSKKQDRDKNKLSNHALAR